MYGFNWSDGSGRVAGAFGGAAQRVISNMNEGSAINRINYIS